MKIDYIDLFSGIGGFALGIKNAGVEIGNHLYSEVSKPCIEVYQKHFEGAENLGNVKDIKTEGLKADLITFGFPCQDLSIAGKRRGFEGDRSSLFFEAIKIIRDIKPNYIIFENVKGLFSSNKGRDWITCLQTISDIGYDGQWQLLNTRWFLPQNRERIYFVGHIRGTSRPEIFPIGELCKENRTTEHKVVKINESHSGIVHLPDTYLSTLQAQGNAKVYFNKIGNVDDKGHDSVWGRVYDTNGVSSTINSSNGGLGAKTGLYGITKDHGIIKGSDIANCIDTNYHKGLDNHKQRTGIYYKHAKRSMKIRRLTPIECERLQGFPDNWTFGADTNRYKMIGNAVSAPVVSEIIRRLYVLSRELVI